MKVLTLKILKRMSQMNEQINEHTFLDTAFQYVQAMLLQWLTTSLTHIYPLTRLFFHPPVYDATKSATYTVSLSTNEHFEGGTVKHSDNVEATHLFRPWTFEELRIQDLLPPVQALDICPVFKTFRCILHNISHEKIIFAMKLSLH